MSDEDAPPVLLVDDDEDLLGLYERYLSDEYDVKTATTGEGALAILDEGCRLVVLDRRLPDISGDEVLERIHERSVDPRVVMVTAVEPDFDIIEMRFDDYLVKPVSKDRLQRTVHHMLTRVEYSELLEEFYRTANKIATLESALEAEELDGNEEFERLRERATAIQSEMATALQDLDDYADAFHEVERLPTLSAVGGDRA